jgi:replication factor A1
MTALTHGAILQMVRSEGQQANPAFQPVLQLLQVKEVGNDRFRSIISDGQYFAQGMLATQLTPLVQSGQLQDNCVIQVEDFMINQVQGRMVIILLKISVVNAHEGQRIGQPVDVDKAGAASAPPSQPAAQPMYNRTNAPPPSTNNYNKSSSSSGNPYGGGGGSNPYGQSSPHGNPSNQGVGGSAPIVRAQTSSSGAHITPIAQLNMYQNRWTIKARVTSKSDVRTWSNAKGEGSLFSVELLDSSGTDIRGTFFKEAVDKFHSMLQVNHVYTFSGGRLKVANMQWNTCKSQFEITFDQNSEIHLDNDTGEIQQQIYEFVKINAIENVDANKNIDVLAVVKHVGEPASLISKKSGKELQKCELTLVDDSGVEITLTVWGEQAMQAPHHFANTPVVAFRRARVSDYGGKSLSASDSVAVNPDVPEAHQLRQWWTAGGETSAVRSLSTSAGGGGKMDRLADRKQIIDIKNEGLGYKDPEKPDWLSFKGTFSFIKKDKEGGAWYTACANSGEPCKNRFKVEQLVDGNWQCQKCNCTYPNCVRRWIFSATVCDDTSTTWVSLFNEQAETLFGGVTADEVYNTTMGDVMDQDAYDSYFAKANHTEWIFKCKVKQEMVNDESRVKTSVVAMHPVDYVKESQDLLAAIEQF